MSTIARVPETHQPPSDSALRWVERCLGPRARVLRSSRLVGGLTADMDRLTVRNGSEVFDVVLRRWSGENTWASGLVERESAGLRAVAGAGIPAPHLLGMDAPGEEAGTPSLVMSALPGQPLLAPYGLRDYVGQMADVLARIHGVSAALDPTDPHPFRSDTVEDWIDDAGLARAAVAAGSETDRNFQPVFVHGDYQQFNVLWDGHRISGVVDWTYTGCGQREVDVGHCRLALAVLFSADMAEQFLDRYEEHSGTRVDPRADIRGLLRFDRTWLDFIPLQLAGRAPVDGPGMPGRVIEVLRAALKRLD